MVKLVYDIGFHKGEDTAHYLRNGCRVVAVEANPNLARLGEQRFKPEIAAGRLKLLNVGIAKEPGRATFHVSDNSEWSSFMEPFATRGGTHSAIIDVDCVRLDSIMGQHGVPDYLKIDIEGNDRICIDQLTRENAPRFVSVELSRMTEDIEAFERLGYDRFKLICQNFGWMNVTPGNFRLFDLHPKNFGVRVARKVAASVASAWSCLSGKGPLVRMSSGPLPDQTSPWLPASIARGLVLSASALTIKHRTGGMGWWFDIHAMKSS